MFANFRRKTSGPQGAHHSPPNLRSVTLSVASVLEEEWPRIERDGFTISVDPQCQSPLAFALSVARGLDARPRRLDASYLYDATGSTLFERITEQPEYYLTRAEDRLLAQHALANCQRVHFAQLEDESGDDVILLWLGLTHEEHPSLREVIGERLGAQAYGAAGRRAFVAAKAELGRFAWSTRIETARLVRNATALCGDAHVTVALKVVHRAFRRIHRDLVKIGPAEPAQLSVQIREQAALQERVV